MLEYKNGELYCENVAVSDISNKVGTPFYLYSQNELLGNFKRIQNAFSEVNPLIAFSVKANSNLSILRLFARQGSGFDIVSGGELRRVLKAGGDPHKVIYAGVGKTADELKLAVKNDILMINLESEAEAHLLSEVAGKINKTARVALRINPDVEAHTHEYITTGKKENKFGVTWGRAPDMIARIAALPNIEFVGLHVHVGSQITQMSPHAGGVKRVINLMKTLKERGIKINYINMGGGFGIGYKERAKAMNVEKLSKKIVPLVKKTDCRLIIEPGRFIVGPAGALITGIIYVKEGDQKYFAITDAGMNDLIRPSLYKAYHQIITVKEPDKKKKIEYDVVGPICESSDFFGKNRKLAPVERGDLLAICDAGAYGYVMASNYNTRPKPPEVLVKDDQFYVINERERYKDLIKGEKFPPHLA